MQVVFHNLEDIEKFMNLCSKYESDVIVNNGSIYVDANSLIALVSLGFNTPFDITFANKKDGEYESFVIEMDKLGLRG